MSDEERVVELTQRVSLLLKGSHPMIQGAVLADLLAIWLAGHRSSDGAEATRGFREELLERHLAVVWELIPVNEHLQDLDERAKG